MHAAQMLPHKILTMKILHWSVDKANYFAFKMDDIEEAHSHVNFMDPCNNRAAYPFG